MNVKAVMKNLKKKGFRETLKIRRKNVELRRLLEEYRIVLNRYKDAAEGEDEKSCRRPYVVCWKNIDTHFRNVRLWV